MQQQRNRLTDALQIGCLRLANRVVLAPMSGITDAPFRRLVARLGAGLVVSEMTPGDALASGDQEARLRAEGQGVGLHVVQLAGCEARWMAEGARIAEASGADIIDINMGCPAKRVTNGYAGSALMREPDLALSLVEATVKAVSVPVTIKMRLGWDASSINAPELARRATAAGVQLVTVHGRTRCQFYEGKADWPAIRAVKDAVTIPVIANGDVRAFADADLALSQSGADGLMVGRGAQGRPWLPGQLARYLETGTREAEPSLDRQRLWCLTLYEEMVTHYGSIGARHARKHLGWFLDVAAARACAPAEMRVLARRRVLTGDNPRQVLRDLNHAYDAFQWRTAA